MPYPEFFVAPMRDELMQLGIEELRSAGDVDAAVSGTAGTLMVVVNSVCGCAAGKARPGLALALRHGARPDRMTSVFAGFDVDATARARSYFGGVMPSSPSIALLKDGQLIYMLERRHIEVRSADQIAAELRSAFDKFCTNNAAKSDEAQTASKPEVPDLQKSAASGPHVLKIQTRPS
ncbi:MAG TPA: BrxA/BrxB family bacilliredoxin [Vicinamibacterales bacterium]